ncbi:ABC transporter permease subunit [Paenibacillus sp. KQZ6P-2]|uniref:ABC transporter permease subunit n=1 Tax=Paenibacillus mangrovi TaxID=2931978 RepID=A0A9X1WSZ1_9BACL|nr:ABC transporter permease subunit [Paenibacillus mangrovi]MCJ8012980.1 ABC transporter permease subunit [Paenibacillus mangrovi]
MRHEILNKKSWIARVRQDRYLLLLVLPCVLYYLIFKYGPMLGIVIAFKDYNLHRGIWDSPWVGFKWFNHFMNSRDFWPVLKNTFVLGFMKLLFGFPAPIILALLINEVRHAFFRRFVQTVSYLPHFISNVIVAGIMTMFLSPRNGIINELISFLGFDRINFLVEESWFRSIYVSSEIWQHLGWSTIIYLAALSTIDIQQYEAARLDGANRWQTTWNITMPGIAPTALIILILDIGKVLEIGFEKVYLLATPAVYSKADIISTYVYRVGLSEGKYSYATAIDLFTGMISIIFIISANWASRRINGNSLW